MSYLFKCLTATCIYLIPAFSGLGAPHWEMSKKAAITGLTFGTGKSHIIRAALESIPYQIKDVITAMELDAGILADQLMVDGGISAKCFIMQFFADLLDKAVINFGIAEVSAMGATHLAGLQQGILKNIEELNRLQRRIRTYEPSQNETIAAYNAGRALVSAG